MKNSFYGFPKPVFDKKIDFLTVNVQTGAYTLVLSDAGKLIDINSASDVNLIIPTNALVPFPIGITIYVRRLGVGAVAFISQPQMRYAGDWITIRARYAVAKLVKVDTDQWILEVDKIHDTGNIASTDSLTINADNHWFYLVTALAETMTINAPTSPLSLHTGRRLLIAIKDNGTARTLAWNATFKAIGVTLPTLTVAGKWVYIECMYNGDWHALTVSKEA